MYVSILYTTVTIIYIYIYIYIYFAINIFSKLLIFVIYIESEIIYNDFLRFMATVAMENTYKLIYY